VEMMGKRYRGVYMDTIREGKRGKRERRGG
jgi:hypothetical protein